MIRYLNNKEKPLTRPMYRENFPEDSLRFVDYYYQYKTSDNEIIVMDCDTGDGEGKERFQVMIHLNPVKLSFHHILIDVNYIVAVATNQDYRKKGKMAELMKQACRDMYEQHQPFTFLMPANPLVYLSSGFRFFQKYEKSSLLIQENTKGFSSKKREDTVKWKESMLQVHSICDVDITKVVSFVNEERKSRYQLFVHKNEAYYKRLLKEVKSEDGDIVVVMKEADIIGVFPYGMYEEQIEARELVFKEGFDPIGILKKIFAGRKINLNYADLMLRIVDLSCLVKLLRSEEEFCLRVKVKDPWLLQNNGCFEIKADKMQGSITNITEQEAEIELDIWDLGEHLFGKISSSIQEWV